MVKGIVPSTNCLTLKLVDGRQYFRTMMMVVISYIGYLLALESTFGFASFKISRTLFRL